MKIDQPEDLEPAAGNMGEARSAGVFYLPSTQGSHCVPGTRGLAAKMAKKAPATS